MKRFFRYWFIFLDYCCEYWVEAFNEVYQLNKRTRRKKRQLKRELEKDFKDKFNETKQALRRECVDNLEDIKEYIIEDMEKELSSL